MFTLAWWTLFLFKFFSVQSCSIVCFNDGYASSDCSHCVCPLGWTGLRCSSASPCGDVLIASAGYLTSPGFPEDYDRNRNCTWTFDSSLSPSVILLRIVSVDLSGAINDSLRITDRSQNLAVIYYSRRDFREGDVIKVDSSVVITFLSGSYVSSRRSFVLEYQVFPGESPVYVYTPNDTTILKGETVSLFCLSSGFPQPVVRWEKDGVNVSLPQGNENGELLIQRANESTDSGLYDCIAENYLGSVRHQFFLAVHVPPVITHAPVDVVLDVYIPRQYVYFRCDAYGIPEPEIHWKKDGSSIRNPYYPLSARRWISFRVGSENFGKYSCYANNSVGAVESPPAVFSGKNASDFYVRGYVDSSSRVNVNSSVTFFLHFRWIEIKIQRIFKDGYSLDGLKIYGLDTRFNDHQRVIFDGAAVRHSGVYRFDILVLVDRQHIFETSVFSYVHVEAFPRPILFSSLKTYSFDPGESVLFICTERQSHSQSSLKWFLNGVKLNQTGPSHLIYDYGRKSYFAIRNLTEISSHLNNYLEWIGGVDVGTNITCRSTYFGKEKNWSVLIRLPSEINYRYHYYYHRYYSLDYAQFSIWSLWSLSTQCSAVCGRNSGFRLRYRSCISTSEHYHCQGSARIAVETCFSANNCSSPTESPTEVRKNTSNITTSSVTVTSPPLLKEAREELSAGVASGVTFTATIIASAFVVIGIVLISKKKRISFDGSSKGNSDTPTLSQPSAANAYLSRPAVLGAKMESKCCENDSANVAVRRHEMAAIPVYEDVQDSSPEKKDKIKWTTTSLYDTVNAQVTVELDASD